MMMESWGLVLIATCITALLRPGLTLAISLYIVQLLSLLCSMLVEGGQADGCTSGFPSIERMERVRDNQIAGAAWDQSAIFPDTSFNCTNGTIQNLTFGANNISSGTVFPELQLWRPKSGNSDNYDFVRRITFNESNQISSLIYQLNGISVSFQNRDVLGFYQPSESVSSSRIQLAVRMPQPVQTMYRRDGNLSRVFMASGDSLSRNPMVSVVTGETVITPPLVRLLICTQILPIVLVDS